MSNAQDIPVWEKYTLTIEEASKYFRIGENKLRRLAEENKDAGWLIMNGNRIQIKRRQFEQVIDKLDAVNVNINFAKNVSISFTSFGCFAHLPLSLISCLLFDMIFL